VKVAHSEYQGSEAVNLSEKRRTFVGEIPTRDLDLKQ
jgi:hypothetical protein